MTWPTWRAPWDDGITYKTEEVSVERSFLALPVEYTARRVLRVATDIQEYDLIESLIRAATLLCERESGHLIRPAEHRMLLSGAPAGAIVFPEAPVRDVTAITYVDDAGDSQAFGGSPPNWIFTPAGRYGKATVQPAYSEAWPSVRCQPDGLIVEYTVGYAAPEEIPENFTQGIALAVAELYKNPDLSNGDGQVANLLGLGRFWPRRW